MISTLVSQRWRSIVCGLWSSLSVVDRVVRAWSNSWVRRTWTFQFFLNGLGLDFELPHSPNAECGPDSTKKYAHRTGAGPEPIKISSHGLGLGLKPADVRAKK